MTTVHKPRDTATSAPRYVIRELDQGDLPAVFDLVRTSLSEAPTQMWEWKHELNPFGRSHALVAETEAGQIIGLRVFLRWKFEQQGRSFRAVRAVDTVTHTKFRRLGLFSSLTNCAINNMRSEGVTMVFNTPNNQSGPANLKLGWSLIGTVEPMYKIVSFSNCLLGLTTSYLRKAPGLNDGAESPFRGKALTAVSELVADSNLDALIDEDSTLWAGLLHTPRSRAYLQWRYADHPTIKYWVETLVGKEGIEAAAIFRVQGKRGLHEVRISELLLRKPDARLVQKLFLNLRTKVAPDYLVAYFPEGTPHSQVLKRNGFLKLRRRRGATLTTLPLANTCPSLPAVEDWGLALGDVEGF